MMDIGRNLLSAVLIYVVSDILCSCEALPAQSGVKQGSISADRLPYCEAHFFKQNRMIEGSWVSTRSRQYEEWEASMIQRYGELKRNKMCFVMDSVSPKGSKNASSVEKAKIFVNTKLRSLLYSWFPRECRLVTITHKKRSKLMARADARLGRTLWVGDSLLLQLFRAWASLHHVKQEDLLSGSEASFGQNMFLKRFLLVNSYTLHVMSPKELNACRRFLSSSVASEEIDVSTCPDPKTRVQKSSPDFNVKYHHSFENIQWTDRIEPDTKTIILQTGHHFWKELHFAHPMDGCRESGEKGKFAYMPHPTGCSFKKIYSVMVTSVARYIAGVNFTGRVIFVTSPMGAAHCDESLAPLLNDLSNTSDDELPFHWEDPPAYEYMWSEMFALYAPKVSFFVLNVSTPSRLRPDAHPHGDCLHYCLPGVPDTWARMLLTLSNFLVG